MVTREIDGVEMVAVRHWKPTHIVFRHPDGTVYKFDVQHNVAMAWMTKYHAEHALLTREKICNCGGGSYRNTFTYANEKAVSVFETGHY